jgi:hypothetical protein
VVSNGSRWPHLGASRRTVAVCHGRPRISGRTTRAAAALNDFDTPQRIAKRGEVSSLDFVFYLLFTPAYLLFLASNIISLCIIIGYITCWTQAASLARQAVGPCDSPVDLFAFWQVVLQKPTFLSEIDRLSKDKIKVNALADKQLTVLFKLAAEYDRLGKYVGQSLSSKTRKFTILYLHVLDIDNKLFGVCDVSRYAKQFAHPHLMEAKRFHHWRHNIQVF